MFVATAAKENGHVPVVVGGGVSEVGGQQDHGVVEEVGPFELAKEVGPAVDGGFFDNRELVELVGTLAVVGKGVVGFIDSLERADRVAGAVEGDEAGGIGLQGQKDGVEEGPVDVGRAVAVRGGGCFADFGLGFVDPRFVGFEPELEFADGGEPFVELLAVAGADLALKGLGLGADNVHDGLSAFGDLSLTSFGLGGVFDKEGGEEFAGIVDRGKHGAAFGVGRRTLAGGIEDERGEAGFVAQILCHVLIERDRVRAVGAPAHGAGGEDGSLGGVPALDSGVGGAGDDGELVANVLKGHEVRRGRVAVALVLGDEVGIVKSEREGNSHEALWIGGRGGSKCGGHGIEHGQTKGDAGLLQDSASREGLAGGNIHDGWTLLGEKGGAGKGGVNQGAEAVLLGAGSLEDGLEMRPVAETNLSPRTIAQNVPGESAGEHFGLFEIDLAPAGKVFEGLAIGGHAGGVDFGGVLFVPVGDAVLADGVVAFEGEAGRVDLVVAACAGGGPGVFGQLVADGNSPANVGLDCRGIGRWRRDVASQDPFIDPDPAEDGRRHGAIGRDFENRSLGEEAGSMNGLERDLLKARARDDVDFFEPVVIAKAGIQEAEVGFENLGHRPVVPDHGGDEGACFLEHGMLKRQIETAEAPRIRLGGVDVAKIQPLVGEVLDEAFRFFVGEKAGDLFVKDFGIAEFSLIGELAEGAVGEGFPEEETETGGDGVVVESAGFFHEGQEIWGTKHSMVSRAESLGEGFSGLELCNRQLLIGCKLIR